MDHLPVFLDVRGRKAIVAGGGMAAARKVELLVGAGARVLILAPEICGELRDMVAAKQVEWSPAALSAAHLADCVLAIAAAEDRHVNEKLHRLAVAGRVPVNAVDQPELCTFLMPAIVDRSPLVVAVSSSGQAPLLARLVRSRLETLLPSAYGRLAGFAGAWRDRVAERLAGADQRRRFWEAVIDGPVAESILAGDEELAGRLLGQALDAAAQGQSVAVGEVYLVGAGPGDPDLLTFKALRLMQRADVVLYDRLIGDGILNLVRRDAERIFVGKSPQNHTMSQEDITRLLIKLARQGKRVLRLKGGDPFIFGRGGEEIEALAQQGIVFQVVPGITAAAGCAAYAGIPLTHRDHAHACVFVTGHSKDGSLSLDWPSLLQPQQTVVVYMGLDALPQIAAGYVAHGGDPSMPAAIVEKGTQANQRVISGTIATLEAKARAAGIGRPSLIIIGTVVGLRDRLSWYAAAGDEGSAIEVAGRRHVAGPD